MCFWCLILEQHTTCDWICALFGCKTLVLMKYTKADQLKLEQLDGFKRLWTHSAFLFNCRDVPTVISQRTWTQPQKKPDDRGSYSRVTSRFSRSKNTRRWRGPANGWRCWRAGTNTRTVKRWASVCHHISSSSLTLAAICPSHHNQ